jgi:hypothetical protein
VAFAARAFGASRAAPDGALRQRATMD